ncbi:MAG: glycerol-3-phosphate 1-O-acyltransferase PlsY [Myxococcales bacterium]|nr:glycerol-3-phosphate 1-O-acyltransferase PlsY [Myxococcales bacterium]
MSDAAAIALVVAAYFMGSIPFGLLIGKKRGVDVRGVGSGNIGATNVARNLGKKTGALVLLLDVLKAAVPTFVATMLVNRGDLSIDFLTLVAIAAILGHCYPVWLKFRGGKGVATSLGVFLIVDPALAGIGIAIFAVLYVAFRRVSVGSISAAIAFPMLLWVFDRPLALVHLGIAGAFIVVLKHRSNILRIFHGEEKPV